MHGYIYENQNSKSFYTMAWSAFVLSSLGMIIGIYYVDVDLATKGFFVMAYLFSVTSCFTLAKVVRDQHEASKFINKMETAKTEKMLAETNL